MSSTDLFRLMGHSPSFYLFCNFAYFIYILNILVCVDYQWRIKKASHGLVLFLKFKHQCSLVSFHWTWLLLKLTCFTSFPWSLRRPHSGTSSSTSDSPIPSPITSSSSVSPLCSSITPSLFHSRLKTYLFHTFYPRSFTSSSLTVFTDFCLHRFFWTNLF